MRLDLKEPEKLEEAKQVLLSLQETLKQQIKKPICLNFKGLIGTFDKEVDTDKAKVIVCEPVQDENYQALQDVAAIIKLALMQAGFTVGEDEKASQSFRIVLVQAQDKRRMIDMKPINEHFADYELAKVTLNELHLSSQNDLETPEGARFPREKLERGQERSTFACEAKIKLLD